MNHKLQGTALITGASSGIGEAYARKLSSLGLNLILVARRKDKLKSLAAELISNDSISANILVADLTKESGIQKVADYIKKNKDITMLINNAGFGTTGFFSDNSLQKSINMINIHINAVTQLCHAALQNMIQQNHGYIINVSSVASFIPMINNVIYSSTKSYVTMFSQALQSEMNFNGYNIKIQALCPGPVYTEFHDTIEYKDFDRSKTPKRLWMSPQDVVAQSLKALYKNNVVYIPGYKNKLFIFLIKNRALLKIIKLIITRFKK